MMPLMTIIASVVVYGCFRRMMQQNVSLKYQYRLFELRDRLRMLAIEEQVDERSEGFRFLDRIISTSVGEMDRISIWRLWGLALTHKSGPEEEVLCRALASVDESPVLRDIFEDFLHLMVSATLEKHTYSILLAAIPLAATEGTRHWVQKNIQAAILPLREASVWKTGFAT